MKMNVLLYDVAKRYAAEWSATRNDAQSTGRWHNKYYNSEGYVYPVKNDKWQFFKH